MKTYFLFAILCLLAFPFGSFSQGSLVKKASKNVKAGNLNLALEQILTATDLSKKKNGKYIKSPNTWIVKGDICHSIFKKEESLLENPLDVAFESYQKAYYSDRGNKYLIPIKIKLISLSKAYIKQATDQFEKEKYAESLNSFEQVLKIESLDFMEQNSTGEDTVIIYNAGLAAFKAQNWNSAITYFSKSAKLDYNGIKSYQLLSESYRQINDINGYTHAVNDCIKKYPDSKNLFGK